MRTRLSIATTSNLPSPVAQTTTRKTRGGSRAPGSENCDPDPGTVVRKAPKRGVSSVADGLSELGFTVTKRSRPTKGRSAAARERERDPNVSDNETLITHSDEEESAITSTAKGKGKGRAKQSAIPSTATRTSRAVPSSAGRSVTYSRRPIRSSSVLTAPPDSTSRTAAQSLSTHTSSIVPNSSSSAVLLTQKAKGKGKAQRARDSSEATEVPDAATKELDETVLLRREADLHILDADREQLSIEHLAPPSTADEDDMSEDEQERFMNAEDDDDDVSGMMEEDSPKLGDLPNSDAPEEDEDHSGGIEDDDSEFERMLAEETKLLDKAPSQIAGDTDGVEKQFANSDDSFEARPYPIRNLLPNFLSSKANARNPFLAPTVKIQGPSPPEGGAIAPVVGTTQLLLGRADPCVCGEDDASGEHVDGCEMLRELKKRGWKVYREM